MEKPTDIWQKEPVEQLSIRPPSQQLTDASPPRPRRRKEQAELWEDAVFLEQLNDFMASNRYEGRGGFGEDFF
jgi:hypothetical protein